MSATMQRDQAMQLAKTDSKAAHKIALQVSEPWFKAQALASIIRYTEDDPMVAASQAAKAASECDDDYKRSAVRAWEIAALAERGLKDKARSALKQSLKLARTVQPFSSRSEALIHLLEAAFAIGLSDAIMANDVLKESCPSKEHWRCKRALRNADQMIQGDIEPRKFYH